MPMKSFKNTKKKIYKRGNNHEEKHCTNSIDTIINRKYYGLVHSAQEARSNAVVMHSEAKIIREHVINQHNGNENNN